MKCPRCQQDAPSDCEFCPGGGASLALECGACGATNAPTHKFCKERGRALDVRPAPGGASLRSAASHTPQHLADTLLNSKAWREGEDKQVTVLFADVVGFSALSERLDPEAVHSIMDGCFELLTRVIHDYEGTINQFTGDGVMALFGAPIAHEDHAMRALEAASQIQEELPGYAHNVQAQWGLPFQMRMGINTGVVVVGRIGDNLRTDYTAQGDTTNIAARLQQMAPPGAVWVGEATYRVASEAFEWKHPRVLSVKGRDTPVPVHELAGRRRLNSRFDIKARRGLTQLVGRQLEFEQLLAAWQDAREGRGRVVSIVGEAGLGKSRLIHEFKQYLGQADASYLEGSCFAYGGTISYLPFVEILRIYLQLHRAQSDAEAKRKIAVRT